VSNTALAPRRSALPDVPSRHDLEALSPADLWTLEERASEIQDACRELNDERLRHWIEVEGKTQAEIAKLVGRSQQRISQRCDRLGIAPASKRGRSRITTPSNSTPTPSTDGPNTGFEEVIDAEVVDEEPAPDPGPRVKCPTCGHMVKPNDLGAWE
jgi:predicted XRE-type DNA-binding protein